MLADDIFATWQEYIPSLKSENHTHIATKLSQLRNEGRKIFPAEHLIFNAFTYCFPQDISVIILGQDPYHQQGQANGLAFSVNDDVKVPPSLRNILKEIHEDVSAKELLSLRASPNLMRLAKQGVLLLNTILTVEEAKPLAHAKLGWQELTMQVLQYLASLNKPLVIMLWGKQAREYAPIFNLPSHLVLQAPHPSPLSAHTGFFGCKHFSKANAWLIQHDLPPISW